MRPYFNCPKQPCYAAVLNIFMYASYAVSVFKFPTLVNEPYFSLVSLVFPCNCIKYQHSIPVVLFVLKV